MRISRDLAAQRLSKAGFELGHTCTEQLDGRCQKIYPVMTPLGYEMRMTGLEVVTLLKDLHMLACN